MSSTQDKSYELGLIFAKYSTSHLQKKRKIWQIICIAHEKVIDGDFCIAKASTTIAARGITKKHF